MAQSWSSRLVLRATVFLFLAAALSASPEDDPASIAPSFVIVELFTSEGCSSCPPADTLLGELASQARQKGLPIYCLAFHVDYWNQLGWKDPFSAAAYSDRQKAYARALHLPQIYTPQMIVNGTQELVGSDRARAEQRINAALERPGKVKVTLQPAATQAPSRAGPAAEEGAPVEIAYAVAGAKKGGVLRIAAVEAGLVTAVGRGENKGRVLREDNVVRTFLTVSLAKSTAGVLAVPLPPRTDRHRTSIVAYVQDPATMAVLGGTAIGYPSR